MADRLPDFLLAESPPTLAPAGEGAHACAGCGLAGGSPGDYLRRRRVELAIAGVCAGRQPLAEIALACGYADQSHMTHALRRDVGMTPHALRALSRLQVANLQDRRRRRAHAAGIAHMETPA